MHVQQILVNLGIVFNNPIVLLIMITFLGIATYTDIKSLKIYNKFNIIFLICRIILVFIPIYNLPFNLNHILGAVIAGLILFIPAMKFTQKMGGDIKLVVIIGLYLGVDLVLILLFLSFFLIILYSFIRKKIKKESVFKLFIPLAPFFTSAFLIMIIINFILF